VVEAPKPIPDSLRKIIIISAVIGYTALIIYLFYFVGFADLFATLEQVNLGLYALAIAISIISIFFHTLVWHRLLQYLSIKLAYHRSLILYWVGIFVDNLIPGGWSGDFFKAYLLSKEPNIDAGKAVASVVAKNMYEAIFNLGNMVLAIILLAMNYSFQNSLIVSIGVVMVLITSPLVFLIAVSFRPEGAKKIVNKIIGGISLLTRNRWNLIRVQIEIDKLLDDYHEGMTILVHHPKVVIQPVIFSFFALVFEVLTVFLVFNAFGFVILADKVIIVRSIAANIEAQGYAFAGYAQIVATALYTALGIDLALAASVALLGGVVVFWLKTAVSYVAFHYVVISNHPQTITKSIEEVITETDFEEKETHNKNQKKKVTS
jgi:uncharacterized protein (TIRG00374 family)